MLSTVLELAGFACLVIAAFLLGGLVAALLVGGVEFLILGLAFDEEQRSPAPTLIRRPKSRPTRLVPWDEPVTNADLDREMAAMMAGKPDGDPS